jgi:ribosome modulation factor
MSVKDQRAVAAMLRAHKAGEKSYRLGHLAEECPFDRSTEFSQDLRQSWFNGYYEERIRTVLSHVFRRHRMSFP